MTGRERLIEKIKLSEKQELLDFLTADLDEAIDMSGGTQFNGTVEQLADYLLEHGVIVTPCKVKDLIDTIIGHNEVVGIWERRKGEEGRYHVLLWRGMAWDISEEYLNRTFLKIFGIMPESMSTADTVNIAITPILKPREEAEQALKEREIYEN